ncbi:MAG: flagellar basal-body rod protein FlgG [Fusobacteriota bacterium]
MMTSLWSAASGMLGQETNMDVISNNLSNVDTNGFKKSRVNFEDLVYQTKSVAGAPTGTGSRNPMGFQVGNGSKAVGTQKINTMGEMKTTGNDLDIAIQGRGYFQIEMPDGSTAYTKDGSFKRNSQGELVSSNGHRLQPGIVIPAGTTKVSISSDGNVSVITGNESISENIGQIETATFLNPSGLSNIGQNYLKPTSASGDPQIGIPGENGFGDLSQNMVEASNVKVVEEMVNMIAAQRAYEVNTKSIQSADNMLQLANNLKR